MVHSLLKYSLVATLCLVSVTAQDDGNGFIFQCDKPGDFALTFDDGPSQYTGSLLSILSEKGVKATFFVLGTQAAQSDISHFVKQTYDAGHQIASHTYDHLDLSSLSPDQIRKQMVDTETVVKKITGVVPAMMRPPYGNCNERCQTVMKELGYTVVQWNVDSNDWKYMEKPNDYDELVTNILDEINPSDASKDSWISLQHDIHKFSIDRTPRIIDSIKAKGYNFVTLAQCLSNRLPAYKDGSNILPTPSAFASSSTSSLTSLTSSSLSFTTSSSVASSSTPSSSSVISTSISNTTTSTTSSTLSTSSSASTESTTSLSTTESAQSSSDTTPLPTVEAASSGFINSPMISLSAIVAVLGFFARI